MRRMNKSDRKFSDDSIIKKILWVFIGIFVLLIVISTIFIYNPKKEMDALEYELSTQINQLENLISDEMAVNLDYIAMLKSDQPEEFKELEEKYKKEIGELKDEYAKTIEFMEKETQKHREFVMQQQQNLIWLTGACAAGALALFAFFGFKSSHDIENYFERELKDKYDDIFYKQIGGDDKKEYLISSIKQEQRAKEKRITFIMQETNKEKTSDSSVYMKKAEEYFLSEGYDIRVKSINHRNKISKSALQGMVAGMDIVVYEASEDEISINRKINNEKDPELKKQLIKENDEKCHSLLNAICNAEEDPKYLIIVTETGKHVYGSGLYTNWANGYVTLLERIHGVLGLKNV